MKEKRKQHSSVFWLPQYTQFPAWRTTIAVLHMYRTTRINCTRISGLKSAEIAVLHMYSTTRINCTRISGLKPKLLYYICTRLIGLIVQERVSGWKIDNCCTTYAQDSYLQQSFRIFRINWNTDFRFKLLYLICTVLLRLTVQWFPVWRAVIVLLHMYRTVRINCTRVSGLKSSNWCTTYVQDCKD